MDRHAFDIAAGPLVPAIAAPAAQSGIDIGVTDSDLSAAPTRGARGRLDSRTALNRPLPGNGYRAVPIAPSTRRRSRARCA